MIALCKLQMLSSDATKYNKFTKITEVTEIKLCARRIAGTYPFSFIRRTLNRM